MMMFFGTMGLVCEVLGFLVIGLAFGVLHAIGFIFWVVKLILDHDGRDSLFVVPLIYAILIFAIFLVYIFELYHSSRVVHNKKRIPPRTQPPDKTCTPKGHKPRRSQLPKLSRTHKTIYRIKTTNESKTNLRSFSGTHRLAFK